MSLALVILVLCVASLWLPWPWPRALAKVVLGLLALIALLVSMLPLDRLYLAPLEERFPVPALPAQVTGFVVLGGGLTYGGTEAPRLNVFSLERALAAARLAKEHPEALVVLSGGGYRDGDRRDPTEAGLMAELLQELGVPAERLRLEEQSRTTWENATLTHAAMQPRAGDTWVLVTSAAHLPRAVGAFRAAGWEVIPYPVAALASHRDWLDLRLQPRHAVQQLSIAQHEWLGLVAYWIQGRSNSLFPAP